MSAMRSQLDLIRQGGRVQRYHGKPVLLPETVAEHSFYVAWICWLYCQHADGSWPSSKLLMAALQHDVAEAVTGDMPGPTKRELGKEQFQAYEEKVLANHHIPNFEGDLDASDREILKFADNMSGYMKSMQEVAMGNRYLDRTLRNYRKYLMDQMGAVQHMDPSVMRKIMTESEGETDVHY